MVAFGAVIVSNLCVEACAVGVRAVAVLVLELSPCRSWSSRLVGPGAVAISNLKLSPTVVVLNVVELFVVGDIYFEAVSVGAMNFVASWGCC